MVRTAGSDRSGISCLSVQIFLEDEVYAGMTTRGFAQRLRIVTRKSYLDSEDRFEEFESIFSGSSLAAFMLSLKERIPLPSPCPSSGNFLGPKIKSATARIMSRCVGWNRPSIGYPLF